MTYDRFLHNKRQTKGRKQKKNKIHIHKINKEHPLCLKFHKEKENKIKQRERTICFKHPVLDQKGHFGAQHMFFFFKEILLPSLS